jgi:hypothetical protein
MVAFPGGQYVAAHIYSECQSSRKEMICATFRHGLHVAMQYNSFMCDEALALVTIQIIECHSPPSDMNPPLCRADRIHGDSACIDTTSNPSMWRTPCLSLRVSYFVGKNMLLAQSRGGGYLYIVQLEYGIYHQSHRTGFFWGIPIIEYRNEVTVTMWRKFKS